MAGSGRVVWYLQASHAGRESSRAIVRALPFRIGRSSRVALALTAQSVSAEHAELYADGDGLRIRDLCSTNGTWVNGDRVIDAPLYPGDVIQLGEVALRIGRHSDRIFGSPTRKLLKGEFPLDPLMAKALPGLLREGAVRSVFQKIVELGGAPVGYEALGRGTYSALPEAPEALFRVAAGLGVSGQLSRLFRDKALALLGERTGIGSLFLNTHPCELREPGLLESLAVLRYRTPRLHMMLEIHERAVTRPEEIGRIRRELTDIGIGLAYDDFGAGQARLLELGDVPPDYLKFDISFVRGIDRAAASRHRLVASLVAAALEIGTLPLAEGVETAGEAETCAQLGFTHAQGYHFGRPIAAEAIL